MIKSCKCCGIYIFNKRAKAYFCSDECKQKYRLKLSQEAGLSRSFRAYRIISKRILISDNDFKFHVYAFQNEHKTEVKVGMWI